MRIELGSIVKDKRTRSLGEVMELNIETNVAYVNFSKLDESNSELDAWYYINDLILVPPCDDEIQDA